MGSNNDEDPVNRLHLPPDTDHLLSSLLTTSQVSRGAKKAKQLSHSAEVFEQEYVRVFDRKEYTQKKVEQFFMSMSSRGTSAQDRSGSLNLNNQSAMSQSLFSERLELS